MQVQDPDHMWRRRFRRRARARALLLCAVAASFLLVACGAAGDSGSGTGRSVTPVADTASCPSAPGPEVEGLPHLSLTCLTSGGAVEMSVLHGKPEVINIWASWCAPCRREMPLLQAAHSERGDRVLFLGVDVKDSRSRALAFLADHAVSYPQVFDADGAFPLRLRLQGVPNTLFVDGTGHVVDRVIGPLSHARLQQGLAALGQG